MTSQFCFHDNSFACADDDVDLVGQRIETLAKTSIKIKDSGDLIFAIRTIYEVELFRGLKIHEVMYANASALSRDHRKALIKLVDHAKKFEVEIAVFNAAVENPTEGQVYGWLCLKKDATMTGIEWVHTTADWLEFKRYFLGVFPQNENHFAVECAKLFDNIYFHDKIPNSLTSLEGNLQSFSITIVKHLTALNDEFRKYYRPNNRVESLKEFSSACGLDVTPEGNASRKTALTFEFFSDGKTHSVVCDPHMKLHQSDDQGNTHCYQNRIYFHEGRPDIQQGKILVGHIGGHL